jgi:hypothetical protein
MTRAHAQVVRNLNSVADSNQVTQLMVDCCYDPCHFWSKLDIEPTKC